MDSNSRNSTLMVGCNSFNGMSTSVVPTPCRPPLIPRTNRFPDGLIARFILKLFQCASYWLQSTIDVLLQQVSMRIPRKLGSPSIGF